MFHLQVGALSIIIRTAVIYLALLAGLRIAGKREIGQMTPFDLVVILLIANAVQNAMVGPDTSLLGGLIAAGVLVGLNFAVAKAGDYVPFLRRFSEGTPTELIENGQFLEDNLRREGLSADEVMMALREHGVASPEDVDMAVLEVDGSISVVPKQGAGVNPIGPTRRRAVRFLQKH